MDTYGHSITTHAKFSFKADDVASFQLEDGSHSELQSLFLLDYRVRTSRWLTDVALENIQEDLDDGLRGNIGTNETQGDIVRGRVNSGWSILWRLSDIAREIIFKMKGLSPQDAPRRISSLTRGLPLKRVQKIETAIENEQSK